MTDFSRLIEHAFPLKQASLDSVHEKNVRHGHISTLHIWPARRPLAACRAALIATLLPDPSASPKPEGMTDAQWDAEIRRRRQELCEKIGGKLVKKIERKKMPGGRTVEREKEETRGGILHWGRKTENIADLEWFRQEIKKAYGGRPPKVLDPFAGGGAIPLEAMRLGCDTTAVDINPVAWFILKCTLEYPQKFAGLKRPLPAFISNNRDFMDEFGKAHGYLKGQNRRQPEDKATLFPANEAAPEGDLAWQVRAWGQWVLGKARRELAKYYPIYAALEPISKAWKGEPGSLESLRLVPIKDDGTADTGALNGEFGSAYLENRNNPRWVAKPTVAYLWARTVTCKNCRAVLPLLKTRWLCKKERKRVLLTMQAVSPGPAEEGPPTSYPTAYLITFTAYGTWLHGRDAGSVDRNHNTPGTAPVEDDEARERAEFERLKHPPVSFDAPRRAVIEQTIREVCGHRGWTLHAVHVRTNHVHVVVAAQATPERVMNDFKSYATRRMVEGGVFPADTRAWTRHGSTRYLWNAKAVQDACVYVKDRQGEALARGEKPLPDGRGSENRASENRGSDGRGADDRGAGGRGQIRSRDGNGAVAVAAGTPRVIFGIQDDVPVQGGNAAQKREHDKRIGAGTMSRAGAKCPCCGAINTMEDIRQEGKAGRVGSVMTAVVVDGQGGKEYRLPTEHEIAVAAIGEEEIQAAFKDVPFGVPEEPTPKGGGSGAGRAFSLQNYGLMRWRDIFTRRQLLALGRFVAASRAAREQMRAEGYPPEWIEAVGAYLACGVDRLADRCSALCTWDQGYTKINHSFSRYALPLTWDFCEGNPMSTTTGNFASALDWVAEFLGHAARGVGRAPSPAVENRSALGKHGAGGFDLVFTDPPYYDAIPYSDLMDFFYIWMRRSLRGLSAAVDAALGSELSPKWDAEKMDGELIDDCSRHDNDANKSKQAYEDGMAAAFRSCAESLAPDGRMVVVFANKQPEAWEALVSAAIRAGFAADGSWPIQTEMATGLRNFGRASLASSVWIVCKKRPEAAKPGWDNRVLDEMRENIATKLRDFWDAGIRGPDFIWAATGPALEAYSKHPVVRRADEPGAVMGVGEFLAHVRRMVVDFVVGHVLRGPPTDLPSRDGNGAANLTDRLDEVTAYYLLHRNDFGMEPAPVGACILYATACGLSDADLEKTWNLVARSGRGGRSNEEEGDVDAEGVDDTDADGEAESGGGREITLRAWNQRRGKGMGYEAPGGRAVPLIDRIHRLMYLWKAGDLQKVDEFLDSAALRKNELFKRVVQSLIELSEGNERSVLERISNHVGARGAVRDRGAALFAEGEPA